MTANCNSASSTTQDYSHLAEQVLNQGINWSQFNLHAHGNSFCAVWYTKTSPTQRHILSTIASKMDVTAKNPFDGKQGRFITLTELAIMTNLCPTTVSDNINVLAGEVIRPIPSSEGTVWMDTTGNIIDKPSKRQISLFKMWQRNQYTVYVERERRYHGDTRMKAATKYRLTPAMLEDYKSAVMGKRALNKQDPNNKLLKIWASASKPLLSDLRQTGNDDRQTGNDDRQTGNGGLESPDRQDPQSHFSPVDKEVDKLVNQNPVTPRPPKKVIKPKAKVDRASASTGAESESKKVWQQNLTCMTKTQLIGLMSGTYKPTVKTAALDGLVSLLLADFEDTVISKAIEKASDKGFANLSYSAKHPAMWRGICESVLTPAADQTTEASLISTDEPSLPIALYEEAESTMIELEPLQPKADRSMESQQILDMDYQQVLDRCRATRRLRPSMLAKLRDYGSDMRAMLKLSNLDPEFRTIFSESVEFLRTPWCSAVLEEEALAMAF